MHSGFFKFRTLGDCSDFSTFFLPLELSWSREIAFSKAVFLTKHKPVPLLKKKKKTGLLVLFLLFNNNLCPISAMVKRIKF